MVPFGGGTSVVGGLVARRDASYAGVVSLDLVRMKRLLAVDPVSMTATLEPGLRGPEAEALLAEHGLTLGHFPQSFEYATIGGFAATRSSGQSSAGYGRFDAVVAGLTVATPIGSVDLGRAPASAAGPDLRQVFLGSEGALGVITSVTVRCRRLPVERVYEGWRWASFDAGAEAVRTLAQSQLLPTVLRLSDENETAINLADPDAVGGDGSGGCLMIVGHEGTPAQVAVRRSAVAAVLTDLGGTPAGEEPGRAWSAGRYSAPYLRDSLLDVGVLVETLETATWWSDLRGLYDDVSAALRGSLGDSSLVLCHISHVYETGASLYFTVAAAESDDPVGRWRTAKESASAAIVARGATITHHHGVGTDHQPWLAAEIGEVGIAVLRAVKAAVDPDGHPQPRRAGALRARQRAQASKVQTRSWVGTAGVTARPRSSRNSKASPAASGSARLLRVSAPVTTNRWTSGASGTATGSPGRTSPSHSVAPGTLRGSPPGPATAVSDPLDRSGAVVRRVGVAPDSPGRSHIWTNRVAPVSARSLWMIPEPASVTASSPAGCTTAPVSSTWVSSPVTTQVTRTTSLCACASYPAPVPSRSSLSATSGPNDTRSGS